MNPSRCIRGDSISSEFRSSMSWKDDCNVPIAGLNRMLPSEPMKKTNERRSSCSWSGGGWATRYQLDLVLLWYIVLGLSASICLPLCKVALKCPPETTTRINKDELRPSVRNDHWHTFKCLSKVYYDRSRLVWNVFPFIVMGPDLKCSDRHREKEGGRSMVWVTGLLEVSIHHCVCEVHHFH